MSSLCGSSAILSPDNCSAILSPPQLGSAPRRRRRNEPRGDQNEPETVTQAARCWADVGGPRERWDGSAAARDLSASDEAASAQDERARRAGFAARQPRQGGL